MKKLVEPDGGKTCIRTKIPHCDSLESRQRNSVFIAQPPIIFINDTKIIGGTIDSGNSYLANTSLLLSLTKSMIFISSGVFSFASPLYIFNSKSLPANSSSISCKTACFSFSGILPSILSFEGFFSGIDYSVKRLRLIIYSYHKKRKKRSSKQKIQ